MVILEGVTTINHAANNEAQIRDTANKLEIRKVICKRTQLWRTKKRNCDQLSVYFSLSRCQFFC